MISCKSQYLYKFDPDWDFAKKHGKANRPGLIDFDKTLSKQEIQTCNCCGEHHEKQPLSLWAHPKELQFLGFGFPLFYEFLKYCMMLLVLNIAMYNGLALQQAVKQNQQFCHNGRQANATSSHDIGGKCFTFMVEMARIDHDFTEDELTIRWIAFCVNILALFYIRIMLTRLESYYQERAAHISGYSILLKGINKPNGQVRKYVYEFLRKQLQIDTSQIVEIILVPEFDHIHKIKKKRKDILQKMRPLYSRIQNDNELKELQKQLTLLNQLVIKQSKDLVQKIKSDNVHCQRVIVTLLREDLRLRVQKDYKKVSQKLIKAYFGNNYFSYYNNSGFRITRAPEPNEIIWKNFTVSSKKKKIARMILGWILSILVIGVAFIGVYFILIVKLNIFESAVHRLDQHPDDPLIIGQYNGAVALVYILMIAIILFGKIILSNLFHKFTELELHCTISTLQASFAVKYALGLFITTAIMTLTVQAIKTQNYYTYPYGLIDEETIMSFQNAIFIPLFWIVHPFWLTKLIKRKLNQGQKNYTQRQANDLMQDYEYDLGKRFGQVIETMWFVYLYSTLLPVSAIISLLGLIFYYWIDKYNLLRRSKVRGAVSARFMRTGLWLLDLVLIFKPIGSFIFDAHLRDNQYLNSNIIMLCVAFVYVLIPKYPLIQIMDTQIFKSQQRSYYQVRHKFQQHNYHRHHLLFRLLREDSDDSKQIINTLREANRIYRSQESHRSPSRLFGNMPAASVSASGESSTNLARAYL